MVWYRTTTEKMLSHMIRYCSDCLAKDNIGQGRSKYRYSPGLMEAAQNYAWSQRAWLVAAKASLCHNEYLWKNRTLAGINDLKAPDHLSSIDYSAHGCSQAEGARLNRGVSPGEFIVVSD